MPTGFRGFVVTVLPSLALLAGVLAIGIAALVGLRRRLLRTSCPGPLRRGDRMPVSAESGRGDWESTLATYKNLRDQGVLSEEEFRKIRTLVEPPLRIGTPDLRARHRPSADPARPRTNEGMH